MQDFPSILPAPLTRDQAPLGNRKAPFVPPPPTGRLRRTLDTSGETSGFVPCLESQPQSSFEALTEEKWGEDWNEEMGIGERVRDIWHRLFLRMEADPKLVLRRDDTEES